MSVLQVSTAWACYLAMALALAGLVIRGRVRFCRFFTLYLGLMFICELPVTVWPDLYWNWSFWLVNQTLYDALKIATALELGYWVFLGFPGAARTARGVAFLLLVATLAAVLMLPTEPHNDGYALGDMRARLEFGTIWIFTALGALVRWYRVPLHAMHRAITFGFVAYLFVFGTVLKLAAGGLTQQLATLQPMAFTAVCWLWAWEAWQPEPEMLVDRATVGRLQPWRIA